MRSLWLLLLLSGCRFDLSAIKPPPGPDALGDDTHLIDAGSDAFADLRFDDAQPADTKPSPDSTPAADASPPPDTAPADAVIFGCDEVTNVGCPAGSKCGFTCPLGFHCMPIGAGTKGSTCTPRDDSGCVSGFLCASNGLCFKYCHADTDCPTPGSCGALGMTAGCDRSTHKACFP